MRDTWLRGICGSAFKLVVFAKCKHGCQEDLEKERSECKHTKEESGRIGFWQRTHPSHMPRARNEPRTLTLNLFLMGCRIHEEAEFTYVQFDGKSLPDSVGARQDIIMRKRVKKKSEKRDGEQPEFFEPFPGRWPSNADAPVTFFEGKSQKRQLELKIISGGVVECSLSGPLDEKLTVEIDSELHVENHNTLPKLVVEFKDEHGAFVPGAPGDMVRLSWEGASQAVVKLGPDGKAVFENVM